MQRKISTHYIYLCVYRQTYACVTVCCHVHFNQATTGFSALVFESHAAGETILGEACVQFLPFGKL